MASFRTSTVEYASPSVRVRLVRCRAPAHGCAAIEYADVHQLVLPQSGVFVKHDGPKSAVVADPAHVVFLTAHKPYRVSHPVAGGDTCLVLEYAPASLLEVLSIVDPPAAEALASPFRVAAALLPPRAVAARRVLWHRLGRGVASALEVDETALALFGAAVAAGRERAGAPPRRPQRETSHRAEIVRATQATIGARPTEPWSLAALARRVHCSPFHLAHVFREDVG